MRYTENAGNSTSCINVAVASVVCCVMIVRRVHISLTCGLLSLVFPRPKNENITISTIAFVLISLIVTITVIGIITAITKESLRPGT